MKQILFAAALTLAATAAQCVATNANGTQRDNFSATGNTNPYTGQPGTHTPRY